MTGFRFSQRLFAAALLVMLSSAAFAQAPTATTFLSGLTAAGALSDTDTFAICQNPAGCDGTSGKVILAGTNTQLKTYMAAGSGGFLTKANNLSDVANAATARTNLGFTFSGNTLKLTTFGAGGFTSGHQLVFDAGGNAIDGGAPGSGGTVTSITQGTGMSFSVNPISTTGTINLGNTAVTPGPYTSANITVDQQGRITAAANGSGSGTVASSSATQIAVYTGPTTVTGSPNITFSSGLLKLDTNASAAIPAFAVVTPIFQMAAPDATATRLGLVSFGASQSGGIFAAASGGTAASPTAVAAGAQLATFHAAGYDGTNLVSSGNLRFVSAESGNFTPTAHGTYAEILSTPIAGIIPASVMRWENDGGVTVPPSVTGGDKGPGTINVQNGLYVAGVAVGGINGNFFTTLAATGGGPIAYTLAMPGYTAVAGNYVCAGGGLNVASGAAATLNVQGTGPKPIKLFSLTGLLPLIGGEFPAGTTPCWNYDGTNYVYQGPTANSPSPIVNTDDTVSLPKWNAWQSYTITLAGHTVTLPPANTLATGGAIEITTGDVTAQLCTTGASTDVINNGQVGAGAASGCITIPANKSAARVTSSGVAGATAFTVALGDLQYFTQTWIPGFTPNTTPLGISRIGTPKVIYGIKCKVLTASGSAGTAHIVSTVDGSDPASVGTALDTTGCDTNAASFTDKDMGVAGSPAGVGTTVPGYSLFIRGGTTGTAANILFTITYR